MTSQTIPCIILYKLFPKLLSLCRNYVWIFQCAWLIHCSAGLIFELCFEQKLSLKYVYGRMGKLAIYLSWFCYCYAISKHSIYGCNFSQQWYHTSQTAVTLMYFFILTNVFNFNFVPYVVTKYVSIIGCACAGCIMDISSSRWKNTDWYCHWLWRWCHTCYPCGM